jgi:cytochrome oxidase Cu insertion factor (SCO1/SenC/PrrC family)
LRRALVLLALVALALLGALFYRSANPREAAEHAALPTPPPALAGKERGKPHPPEALVVGKVAPDFEAVDQDGVAFKLSDYRGKVVALDFWGFW